MTSLSAKQQSEANSAIIDYLTRLGYTDCAQSLQAACGVDDAAVSAASQVLERKWLGVIRLQRKVLELEEMLKSAQQELKSPQLKQAVGDSSLWIPRPPAAFEGKSHRLPITAVTFHPVFTFALSASEDATIKVWDYETGEYEVTLKGHTKAVNDISFDAGGHQLVSCSADLTIKLWSFEKKVCVKTIQGHEHNISSVCFDEGGAHIISASRDKTIRLFEVATGLCTRVLSGHTEWVRCARIAGTTIVSCSNDQTVRVWDSGKDDARFTLTNHDHVVECVAFAPPEATESINKMVFGQQYNPSGTANLKGPFFASGSRDRSICIFDASTGQCLATLVGHDNWVRGLTWHPKGKYLISCADDKSIRVWDVAEKRQAKAFEAHSHFVSAIAIQPKCRSVISGSVDNSVKFWNCS
eukprot:m.66438 g.66438  ORF g.66438 m.66438 type:complete len:412 (+) comp12115_c0_seq3:25-1260(+)